uniref:Uncharacterized protein n=1 Tax=Glossina palpalis gambiensis TaxID=67801 RepID=A0A1B0B1K0_9MUSC
MYHYHNHDHIHPPVLVCGLWVLEMGIVQYNAPFIYGLEWALAWVAGLLVVQLIAALLSPPLQVAAPFPYPAYQSYQVQCPIQVPYELVNQVAIVLSSNTFSAAISKAESSGWNKKIVASSRHNQLSQQAPTTL